MANATVKVQTSEGEVELQVFSEEEIDTLLNNNDPASRKQIMEHMKLLGRPVTELIKMKVPERKAFILERYAELGVKGAKGKAKGGTVTQLKPGTASKVTASKAAPAAATKAKVSKASPPPDEDDEDDEDDKAAPAAGADVSGLVELIEQQGAALSELKELIGQQEERFDRVLSELGDQMKLLLDTHFMVRSALPTAAGLSEDDVVEVGNEAGNYGRLLVGEVAAEATGND